ncbi:acetylcholinesterase-1-like protein [Dinothrombium tinctorium]|uniref:acetylcholinesterase n=1 Tax=Dinothrombium tinctorium TaxID=1965070 RepID=A0A3S3S3P9_9ACAR|nr:acetylcholinesterase-1-like protein [Dinothrombium tinctorium]
MGTIEGKVEYRVGKQIATFLGVPYAKPAIGSLRFEKPQNLTKFDQIYRATVEKPACLQWKGKNQVARLPKSELFPDFHAVNDSEDCLYLNIYAPIETRDKPKTVMVWIHGGAFLRGFINFHVYDGAMLSAFGEVVVVFVSYRLGIMGFMSAGEKQLPGNLGLLDQVFALKWIRANIYAFGGDPNKIVLFGQGSGAVSIGYHLISPLSQHLFQRAIMQSGNPLSPTFLLGSGSAPYKLEKVAKRSGCSFSKKNQSFLPKFENATIDCLRQVSANSLILFQEELLNQTIDTVFYPIEDGEFLNRHPFDSVYLQKFGSQQEVLMGRNSNEGSFYVWLALPFLYLDSKKISNVTIEEIKDELKEFGPRKARQYYEHLFPSILSKFKKPNATIARKELEKLIQKVFFTCPEMKFIDAFTNAGKRVYYYELAHETENSPWPKSMTGSKHFDEIQYIFGHPLTQPRKYTFQEIQLSLDLMRNWISFAKTGKPYLKKWTANSVKSKSKFVFDKYNYQVFNRFNASECALHDEVVTVAASILRYYDD